MEISRTYEQHILEATGASAIKQKALVQSLWSGYGKILRLHLEGGNWPVIIAKLVAPPRQKQHPRGWNTDIGHRRKLQSYQVEETWYRNYALGKAECRMARFISALSDSEGQLIVMEDLNASGYDLRKQLVQIEEIKACLSWMAHFHAFNLGKAPQGLWEEGTYWHLATRPEEWRVMRDGPLKRKAAEIDEALRKCTYRTLVHGDAKLANFCFARDGRVAAVDFQYVGGGCGMKDVAYFLGSCLDEASCARFDEELLNHYFATLRGALSLAPEQMQRLEQEWRDLYPLAWADFTRFLEGWMPSHKKQHRYSREMVSLALKKL